MFNNLIDVLVAKTYVDVMSELIDPLDYKEHMQEIRLQLLCQWLFEVKPNRRNR